MLFGGVVRTLSEFERILSAAGFRLVRTIPTAGALSVIEAATEDEAA